MNDISLLILRIVVPGLFLYRHALPGFHLSPNLFRASDLLQIMLALARIIFPLGVLLGVATRLLSVAAFFVLAFTLPREGGKELTVLYTIPFVLVLLQGPGRFSFDWFVKGRR